LQDKNFRDLSELTKAVIFKGGFFMIKRYWVIILAFILVVGWSFIADNISTSAQEEQRKFMGVAVCKACHTGKIAEKDVATPSYEVWKDKPHAHAYESLASEESKALAKDMGIEDPQKADECLKCHITAFGVDATLLGKKYTVEEGVSCEACHGAGEKYANIKVKKAITAGETEAESVGLVVKPGEETCLTCHNEESPTYKEFKFEEAVKEILHPIR
jgi:hypothetical protein